jgi:hypothetical protein
MDTNRDIAREEPPRALFTGLVPTLVGVEPDLGRQVASPAL